MQASAQRFQLNLDILTLPFLACHLHGRHGHKHLRLDLSKKHLPPQIWVFWVVEVEHHLSVLGLFNPIGPTNLPEHRRLYRSGTSNRVTCRHIRFHAALVGFIRNSGKRQLQLANLFTISRSRVDGRRLYNLTQPLRLLWHTNLQDDHSLCNPISFCWTSTLPGSTFTIALPKNWESCGFRSECREQQDTGNSGGSCI